MNITTTTDPTSFSNGNTCPAKNSFLPIMVSAGSLLGCLYVIITYLYVRALRQHPAGIMFGMSVYGAIYQFLYLLDRSSDHVHCNQMALFVDFFLTGQETYMLIFAIDLLMALKNPFSASKGQMKKYHVGGFLWSLLCAIISHFDTNYALFGFCWVNASGEVFDTSTPTRSTTTNPPVVLPLASGIFFGVYIVMVYCTSLVALLRTWNTFVQGLPDTFKTRHRIHRHLKYYVGCYFGYWTLVLACYAAFTFLHEEEEDNTGVHCRIWHLLSCLLLSKGMVNSLIWTRTSNILKIVEQLRASGGPSHVHVPLEEDSINWALRLEILTNTTKGICESVDQAERQANTSEDPLLEHERKERYTQIEEIILETRTDHGHTNQGVVFYDYAPHIFRSLRMEAKITTTQYRQSMQQTTKERVSEGKSGAFFYFTQDCKYVVKTMTHEELKFLLSILPQYTTYIKNNTNTFVTRFFGCHAITMYGKTVFFMVMQSVFDTTLQIHERFDLKGSWVGRLEGRKPTGTIAQCKFCKLDYVVGRSHDQLCRVRYGQGGGEGFLRHQYDQVGKDLNWNRHMTLPQLTARAVASQLIKDSNFLCQIHCIDYSLLVGIHHRSFNVSHYSSADPSPTPSPSPPLPSSIDKPFHQMNQGGMTVNEVHGPGIYFMGLIDILQQWNFRKRVEHFVRVYILFQDRYGISVVNPKEYAQRFQQRVVNELIYDHSDEGEIETVMLGIPPSSWLEGMDPYLFDSGRTRSTTLESCERVSGSSGEMNEGSIAIHRQSHSSQRPLPSPIPTVNAIPMMPLPSSTRSSRIRTVTVGSNTSSITSSEGESLSSSPPEQPIRLSGGLVMEAPRATMYYSSRSSLPLVYPLPHAVYASEPLPLRQCRRPLAPLVSSPSVSSFVSARMSDAETGGLNSSNSSCRSSGSNCSCQRSSCPLVHSNMESSTSTSEAISLYNIVRTPTFPDPSPHGTMSA